MRKEYGVRLARIQGVQVTQWFVVPFTEVGHWLYISTFIYVIATKWEYCSCFEEKQVNLYIIHFIIQSTSLEINIMFAEIDLVV